MVQSKLPYSHVNGNDGYPINLFPEIIRNAIIEVSIDLDLPVGLVADCALAAISLVCQDKINVDRYNKFQGPVSLFIFTIADKSTGKSTAYKPFMNFIDEFEEEKHLEFHELNKKYEVEKSRWSVELEGALSAIKVAKRKNLPLVDLNKEHDEVWGRKPIQPKEVKIKFEKVSPVVVLESLHENWPSASLISSEGGTVFNSQTLNNLSDINKLWSGEKITLDRKSESSFILKDARLSIFLMTHSKIFIDYLDGKGSQALDNGFIDRCLISKPYSTSSELFNTTLKSENLAIESSHLEKFGYRLKEILRKPSGQPPILLKLSDPANQRLKFFYDLIKNASKIGNSNSIFIDFPSKLPETSARLAALFHYFSGAEGLISDEMIYKTNEICAWYQWQFINFRKSQEKPSKIIKQPSISKFEKIDLFPNKVPQHETDARDMKDFLRSLLPKMVGCNTIRLGYIKKTIGHPFKRSSNRTTNAIQLLMNQSSLRIYYWNNEEYYQLNPLHFEIINYGNAENNLSREDAFFINWQ